MSVDELVRRALANSPQLPIAAQTLEAARQRLGAARSFANPTLELVPRIVGNRDAADTEVILSQPLDFFGRRRAAANVAAAELRGAQARSTLAERSLSVQVKNAAADLFAAQEAESLGQAQLEVAQLFRDAAARRAELGDVPPVQVQRADLELLRVQNELTGAQSERLARRAVLNQLIGQEPQAPLRVALPLASGLTDLLRVRPAPFRFNAAGAPSSPASSAAATAPAATAPAATAPAATIPGVAAGAGVNSGGPSAAVPVVAAGAAASAAPNGAEPNGAAVSGVASGGAEPSGSSGGAPLLGSSAQLGSDLVSLRAQVLPGALANRPDVLSAQAALEARQAQVQVLRRRGLPDIELQARRGAFFGQRASYALRAVVTLPLFDFGSLKRERRAVQAEANAQQGSISLLRSQVALQVEQALLRLQQQRQTVERFRTGIVPLTLDLLRKTQIGYAAGASTYLEVLEAQRTLRQVQTEYLQALVGTRTQEAALEGALGAAPAADLLGALANPSGPAPLPGVAAPGTVPPSLIPPVAPPALAPPSSSPPLSLPATGAAATTPPSR